MNRYEIVITLIIEATEESEAFRVAHGLTKVESPILFKHVSVPVHIPDRCMYDRDLEVYWS